MRRNPKPEAASFNPRVFATFLLFAFGASLAMFSFASTPPSGMLTDSSGPLTYTAGPFFQPNVFGNSIAGECDPDPSDPLTPCDVYRLTVSLPANYAQTHPNQSVFVRIEWATQAADFDLYVWDAMNWPDTSFPTGAPIAQSKQAATNFEQAEIPAVGGTHQYVVQVSTTLPAGQSFTGSIFIGPASPASVPVVPPGNASGIAPRFQEYIPSDANGAPSSSLGLFAGEPTMFANPLTNSVFYQGLFEILRLKFNDSTSPAKALWEFKDSPTGISNKVTVDPILVGDPGTGRVWAMQLSGGQSVTDYSDDDGENWSPTLSGGFGSGVDHEGQGAGPYPTTGTGSLIPHPTYPNAVYYCSQDVATAFCSRSDNGGQTFGPIVPVYDSVVTKCVGLHGHPKVAPDGTVYVPNKGCGLDTPVLGNGFVNVVVSEDAGVSWNIRRVPDSTGSLLSKGDPSVAIGKDNKVYLAYQNLNNNHLYVAVSANRGVNFSPSVDVGALAGVNYSVFPAAVAGDAGRAAVAFFGSTYNGPNTDYQGMDFPGVWYLFVATTYDSGNTWFVANATPDSPIQGAFGGISGGGDGRNHYDFIDAVIDPQGRVLAANSIGCSASCPHNGGPNTFQKLAGIVRQSGGRRMYGQFDPVEPALPKAPLLNGYRTAQVVSLTWPEPDGSGLPITGYNIYRSIDVRPSVKIVSGTTQRHFVDATDPAKTYSYRVRAINAQGEGPSSNVFAPTVGQNAPQPELSCNLPGQVYTDRIGEGGAVPNNDIASFSIAEPQNMPGKLVFVINNAQPALVPAGNSNFYVYFDPPSGGRSYRLSLTDNEVTFYQNGQFVTDCGTEMLDECRDWQHVADLDPASGIQPDGSVRLVIDKAQLNIHNGDVLLGIAVREDTVGNPSSVILSDYAGGRQDYTVVGNDFCAGPPVPISVVSRMKHNTTDFDVNLLPPTTGIECRSGGANGVFKMVVTFPLPVTVSGTPKATVTSGTGSVSNVTVNSSQVTIDLTGVTNAQRLVVTLNGVTDANRSGNVPINMAVLLGDTNANGTVNSSDVSETKASSGTNANSSNFRRDVNVNGSINSSDVSVVKVQSGTALPPLSAPQGRTPGARSARK